MTTSIWVILFWINATLHLAPLSLLFQFQWIYLFVCLVVYKNVKPGCKKSLVKIKTFPFEIWVDVNIKRQHTNKIQLPKSAFQYILKKMRFVTFHKTKDKTEWRKTYITHNHVALKCCYSSRDKLNVFVTTGHEQSQNTTEFLNP